MITSHSSSTIGSGTARHPRSLEAQLSTARAKMADWVTCPSVKTPEGKAQLKKAAEKVRSIESEIKKADDAAAEADAAKKDSGARAAGAGPAPGITTDAQAELGRRNPAAAQVFGASPRLGLNLSLQA